MSSEHTIPLATAGVDGARGEEPVSMPVDELVASNGLVTGQSGADPAESVRQLATALLDAGETLLVVDPAGDFDTVADHSAALHVGGDRDCDVSVEPSAVDRVASLALDGASSVILDLTAFDASAADDLLEGLTDELVDARRSRNADLLLVVHECHRWLASDGPATRTAENLVQLGGRRHDGVGIVGVTDQPADVREDVRSGIDWILAHRLTWREDVRALEGMIDDRYVDALETLDDAEAIYNAGWEAGARRVSVGGTGSPTASDRTPTSTDDEQDLFAGLPDARSPEDEAETSPGRDAIDDGNDGDVAALRDDLAEMENRVASLEAKLEARETVENMAERIADAITEGLQDADIARTGTTGGHSADDVNAREGRSTTNATESTPTDAAANDDDGDGPGGSGDVFDVFDDGDANDSTDTGTSGYSTNAGEHADVTSANGDTSTSSDAGTDAGANADGGTDDPTSSSTNGTDAGGMSFEPVDFGFDDPAEDVDSTIPDDFGPPARNGSGDGGRTIPSYLKSIVRSLEEMDATTRRMLGHYVEEGTDSPMDAHYAAGGGGDRTRAYAHNRQLRTNGLVEHVGKGKYAPRLREYVVDEAGHSVPEHELDRAVDVIRRTVDAA